MLDPKIILPATDLETALLACDPAEPLQPRDQRYADFSTLRRGVGITRDQRALLSSATQGRFHHGCLCGHAGSGKSTELLVFKEWADHNNFLTNITEVDEQLGHINLESTDIFLLAATAVEQAMEEFGRPLPNEAIRKVVAWFAEVIQEDRSDVKSEITAEASAQLGGSLPLGLGKLIAKLTAGVKALSSHAVTTKEKLRNYPDTLINMTNDLLRIANDDLKRHGKENGLLLLFDNFDRFDGEQIDKALFRGSELTNRLESHAIYTIPIALEYAPRSGPTQDCFGFSIVLPMLALRKKSEPWATTVAETKYETAALAQVKKALAQRIDLNLFAAESDVDLLVKMCGGCIRDLMHLVRLAFRHAGEETLFSSSAVNGAIREMRATNFRRMESEDYRLLAALAKRPRIFDNNEKGMSKEQKSRLLFNRFALEYLDDDEFPWMDVHPLVIEIEEFRNALHA